jgi:predicted transcriptional regulator
MESTKMMTVRLPEELEQRVQRVAMTENRTKTQVIHQALEVYLQAHETQKTAYDLGEDLFGQHGSGSGRLSTHYKQQLKEKLHAKYAH